jgi:hypothetical protein
MKTTIFAGLGLALCANPAQATCHHYSTWNYPWAQSCAVDLRPTAHSEPSNWYVEIKPETIVEPGPTESDKRTTDQIKEFVQHNIALSLHHDELDEELKLLIQKELTTSELKGK